MGCPIRKSADHSSFATPRSLSQLYTSFIASACLGIHRVPLRTYFIWLARFPAQGTYSCLSLCLWATPLSVATLGACLPHSRKRMSPTYYGFDALRHQTLHCYTSSPCQRTSPVARASCVLFTFCSFNQLHPPNKKHSVNYSKTGNFAPLITYYSNFLPSSQQSNYY